MGLIVKWEERAKSQLPARHRQCWVPLAEGRWGTIPHLPHFIQRRAGEKAGSRKRCKMRSRNSAGPRQKEQIANSEHLSLPRE